MESLNWRSSSAAESFVTAAFITCIFNHRGNKVLLREVSNMFEPARIAGAKSGPVSLPFRLP